jgi:hypothetical protein
MKLTNEKNRLNAEVETGKKRMDENEEKMRNIKKVEDETKRVTDQLKELSRVQRKLKGQTDAGGVTGVSYRFLSNDYRLINSSNPKMNYKRVSIRLRISRGKLR